MWSDITPLPWTVEEDSNDQPNIYGPTSDDWVALFPHSCLPSLLRRARRNAAFVVVAVNHHKAIVDLLTTLLDWHDKDDRVDVSLWEEARSLISKIHETEKHMAVEIATKESEP